MKGNFSFLAGNRIIKRKGGKKITETPKELAKKA
jgi:hypothetical protein